MAAGRKPKPVEQRVAEGNPGHRPLPDVVKLPGAYVTEQTFAEPPDHLPDSAKTWWLKAVPVLRQAGVLETVDEAALEMMAVQYARMRQAGRIVDRDGPVARGSTGQFKEHPMLETERKAMGAFLRLAEQFALTPVARTRLGLAALQARTLHEELNKGLGEPKLEVIDAE